MSDRLQIIVELITIGREILDGRVVDTNAVRMAEILKTRGLIVRHAQRVDDDIERIVEAFELASTRSDVILTTGGLGPTSDDLTPEAFAKFLGTPLNENPEALFVVESMLKSRGRPMSPAQRKQALVPEGVDVVKNPNGTAPGLFLKRASARGPQYWALMPGVPKEMIAMLKDDLLPRFPGDEAYRTRQWATHFVAEAALQDRLQNIINALPKSFELSFRTRYPENHIGLHASCQTLEDKNNFDMISKKISDSLGRDAFSTGTDLEELETIVLQKARDNHIWISCMESCTGGLISKKLTSVAGSSENFYAAWTTYHNEAKINLGVDRDLIIKYGAVSESVAISMAEAGLAQMQHGLGKNLQSLCVSTTGVAGPGGGTDLKPVGLCYVALAQNGHKTEVIELRALPGLSREAYQMYFTQNALEMIRLRLM